ncbi:MAG: DUF5711 family protein [Oscillospiraceae bacterium]|nr:DUF5711 family protein [Oscillospiraceae bacterium]
MNDRELDNLTREEFRRSQAAPRRSGGFGRALRVLLTLLIVLAVVVAAAWKDLKSLDSVKRLFSYNKITQDEQGKAELYAFSNDRSNVFALLGDHLIVASTTNVTVLGDDGSIVYSGSVKLASPAIAVGGQTAAVYDIGAQTLLVFSASGLVRDMSGECSGSILSVSLNPSDYLTLNAEKSGYKSTVTVYDASGEKVFAFNSSERYVIDAAVLRDCKHMAAVTLGEANGAVANTVSLYSLGSEKAASVNTLTGSLLLSLDSVAGSLACLTDESLTFFTAGGSLAGSYRFEYPYLRGISMEGDGFAALLLSRYRSGSALRIVTVGTDGEALGGLDSRGEVLSLSAAGNYLAVLYSDSLVIYTPQMEEYARLVGTEYARAVIMRDDGTAVLIGSASAWLYIP